MSKLPTKVVGANEVNPRNLFAAGAQGLSERVLLGLTEGMGFFDMRYIALQPGGVSSDHQHPWEQANFVLQGTGVIELDGTDQAVTAKDFVYVPPNVQHRFRNEGQEPLMLLCVRGPNAE